MMTPGAVEPPVQVTAVPVAFRVEPLSTEPVSLFLSVFAVVSGVLPETVKLSATAKVENPKTANALSARADTPPLRSEVRDTRPPL